MLAVQVASEECSSSAARGRTAPRRSAALRRGFFIGGPVALLLAALGGYLVAGAALRPMEAMRRRAQEISTSSLDERLPVPATGDEVARLGETLNGMLERIEEGLARERRFVSDASHELRTPLALLKTELELALRAGRSPEQLRAAIESAAGETDRLARIADDLLLLARSEQGHLQLQLEPLDSAELLDTVARRFARTGDVVGRGRRREARRRSAPARAGTRQPGRQRCAPRRRRRIAPRGAPQRLGRAARARSRHGLPAGASSGTRSNASAVPTRPAAAKGAGLGLAIVETIARAHGGRAHAANRDGGGADVWIQLPA